jgi:hypothetical protein
MALRFKSGLASTSRWGDGEETGTRIAEQTDLLLALASLAMSEKTQTHQHIHLDPEPAMR